MAASAAHFSSRRTPPNLSIAVSAPLDYQYITTAEQLREFCDVLTQVETIAMDTEFVSERTYRSDLCLVQVEAEGRLALLDACVLPDMTMFPIRYTGPSSIVNVTATPLWSSANSVSASMV